MQRINQKKISFSILKYALLQKALFYKQISKLGKTRENSVKNIMQLSLSVSDTLFYIGCSIVLFSKNVIFLSRRGGN